MSAATEPTTITRVVPVDEASQVGDARRAALLVADRAGMDETARGRVALVATELATNLARHARGGMLLLRQLEGESHGVELLSVDRGPGMELARALSDGFSTGGTAGAGLGAVRRIADVFDAYSRPGGTVLLARIAATGGAASLGEASFSIGVICAPAPGEDRSGDSWAVGRHRGRLRLLLVDGLGHGPIAAEAAAEAVRLFHAYPEASPETMLGRLHDGLRATRGAALAVAEIVPLHSIVRWAGVGNIAASIVSDAGARNLMSHNGIVGHQMRRVQEMTYPWPTDAVLVMASDGLRSQWRLDEHPGVAARDPSIVAGVLFRDHLRGRDDATVLVARGSSAPS